VVAQRVQRQCHVGLAREPGGKAPDLGGVPGDLLEVGERLGRAALGMAHETAHVRTPHVQGALVAEQPCLLEIAVCGFDVALLEEDERQGGRPDADHRRYGVLGARPLVGIGCDEIPLAGREHPTHPADAGEAELGAARLHVGHPVCDRVASVVVRLGLDQRARGRVIRECLQRALGDQAAAAERPQRQLAHDRRRLVVSQGLPGDQRQHDALRLRVAGKHTVARELLRDGMRDVRERGLERQLALQQQHHFGIGLDRFRKPFLETAQRRRPTLDGDQRGGPLDAHPRARQSVRRGFDPTPRRHAALCVGTDRQLGGAQLGEERRRLAGRRRLVERTAQQPHRQVRDAARVRRARRCAQRPGHPAVRRRK
jgi:hypothetical protein